MSNYKAGFEIPDEAVKNNTAYQSEDTLKDINES